MPLNAFSKHFLEAAPALWLLQVRQNKDKSFLLVLQGAVRQVKTLKRNSFRIRSLLFPLALAICTSVHCSLHSYHQSMGWRMVSREFKMPQCPINAMQQLLYSLHFPLVVVNFWLDSRFLQKLILTNILQTLYLFFVEGWNPGDPYSAIFSDILIPIFLKTHFNI